MPRETKRHTYYPLLQISKGRTSFGCRIPIEYVQEIERRLGKKLLQRSPYTFEKLDEGVGFQVIFQKKVYRTSRKLQVGFVGSSGVYSIRFPKKAIKIFEGQCQRVFFQGDPFIVSLLPEKPGVQVRFQ